MRTQLGVALCASLLLCLPFAGCDDETETGTGGGGGSTSGTGGSGGTGGGTGGSTGGSGGGGYTLDTVCNDLPAAMCAARQQCCTDSGLGYDEAGCVAFETSECEANVADVNAGLMTFDPTNIDTCMATMATNLEQCFFTIVERMEMLADYKLCQTIFQGQVAAGDACERDAQCAQPADADRWVVCDNVCTEMAVLSSGDACTWGPGMTEFCGSGLYCNADTSGQPPWDGTCATATALGAGCTTMLECGLGAYCDIQGTDNCEPAKAAGESCQTPLECASMDCPTGGGLCGEVGPLVDAEECGG